MRCSLKRKGNHTRNQSLVFRTHWMEGVYGVAFVEAAIRSYTSGGAWAATGTS
jgi:hypothetical protein